MVQRGTEYDAGLQQREQARSWHRAPLARLLAWLAAVALAATVIQFAIDASGSRIDLRDEIGDGRFILIALAAVGVLVVLSFEHERLHRFGFSIGDNWASVYLATIAAGALCCAASYFVAVSAGPLSFVNVPPHRWLSAFITACLAFLFAPLQEIVFRGYLLTLARARLNAWSAIVLSALLFALTIQLHLDQLMASPTDRALFVGAFLAGALLATMRLYHGSIVAPVGAVTGWIFVQILVQRTHVVVAGSDRSVFTQWLCAPGPGCSDPMRNPWAWCIFAAAIAVYGVLSARTGNRLALDQSPQRDLPPSFRKFYPFSGFIMMAPLDVLLARLAHARFSVAPLSILRLLTTLAFSAINTVISLPERLLLPHLLRHVKVPDPVIIVGMHRSGTTHLHNLMALDRQFVVPRAYQVFNPIGFLFSGWLLVPLVWLFSPSRRPLDAVEFSLFGAQEEEFAMTCCSGLSPYWGIIFPRQGAHYERYLMDDRFDAAERAAWRAKLLSFLRKLCLFSKGRPLLKNPCNTGRVAMVRELFPQAKFVHLHRNPYRVYLSAMDLRRHQSIFQLQNPATSPESHEARFPDWYVAVEDRFYASVAKLPPHQVVEVRYEDLDLDPIGQLERIYRQLGLTMTADYRARVQGYLRSIAGYQKNIFASIAEDRHREVREKLAPLFQRWGYSLH